MIPSFGKLPLHIPTGQRTPLALPFLQSLLPHARRGYQSSDHKYSARGASGRAFNHKFYLAVVATCSVGGFLAGSFTPIDHKNMPSPFILEDIESELRKIFECNPDRAAGMVLLALEHCVGLMTGQSMGHHTSCQTCADIIDSLTKVHVIKYSDAVTLSAVVAIRFLGGPEVPWRYGRRSVNRRVKDVKSLDRESSLSDFLTASAAVGFSTDETIALMACHGVGRTTTTAYPLQWKKRAFSLDNTYYTTLATGRYERPAYDLQGFLSLKGSNPSNLAALPFEVEMVNLAETKPIVEKFAADHAAWSKTFTSAFSKLIEQPWAATDFREYVALKNEETIRSYNATRRTEISKE
ncbi:peroxidase [Perkinsela sp. CCAP 1560/4]|nr:peroxidase [Perkinsela sp. CCAP 1560/4]|eukprot:KNH07726.1 peroxidase [Perkinsela sp. CCAP 1560/4]